MYLLKLPRQNDGIRNDLIVDTLFYADSYEKAIELTKVIKQRIILAKENKSRSESMLNTIHMVWDKESPLYKREIKELKNTITYSNQDSIGEKRIEELNSQIKKKKQYLISINPEKGQKVNCKKMKKFIEDHYANYKVNIDKMESYILKVEVNKILKTKLW